METAHLICKLMDNELPAMDNELPVIILPICLCCMSFNAMYAGRFANLTEASKDILGSRKVRTFLLFLVHQIGHAIYLDVFSTHWFKKSHQILRWF